MMHMMTSLTPTHSNLFRSAVALESQGSDAPKNAVLKTKIHEWSSQAPSVDGSQKKSGDLSMILHPPYSLEPFHSILSPAPTAFASNSRMATFACLLGTLITVLPTGLANANNGSNGKHFLLVHGLGHGGWCWYKVTAALQEAGHMVTAVDLTSSGNNKVAADDVTDVARFLRPLTDFLAAYDNGRVILVGHSFGGSAISYAMEAYPEKVEKAVFLAALMPTNGQTFLPIRTLLARASILLAKRVLILNFRNGLLPSSVSINLEGVQANFYNRSPLEVCLLGTVLFTQSIFAVESSIQS
ncbi:hypothetical protein KP509_1Z040300 [Ceratopteris richardii]|nr:hypothetical protein KP509_1Z040300 [Ceratopteris richardii]